MAPDCPTAPYYRRKDEKKTVVCWPDRSLFLMELEFLLRFDKDATENLVVVIAGLSARACVVCACMSLLHPSATADGGSRRLRGVRVCK
jgi:hypothetical protein